MTGLSVRNIHYERQQRQVLQDINLELQPRQLLFVAGRNGSGKSTLLRIICGLVTAQQGDVYWSGYSILECASQYQQAFCYVGHKNGIKSELSVAENIRLMCALAGRPVAPYELVMNYLDAMGLDDPQAQVSALSAGQARRLALLRCLVSERRLWVLDEPFTALDRDGVTLFQQHLMQHLEHDGMVVMASHQNVTISGAQIQLDLDA